MSQTVSPRLGALPLPTSVRVQLEALFGADLRSVRVHPASPEAVTIGARAFARGDQIHFAPGEYAPWATEGRRVLAHEVAHVMQQRCGRVPNRATNVPLLDEALEREAHAAGALAVSQLETGWLPVQPWYTGRIPARHTGASAIQCLMDQKSFQAASAAPGARNKIAVVDGALAQFIALDKVTPRDYAALMTQLRALYQACATYKQTRPDSKRNAGVDALMRQIAREEVFLNPLALWFREPDAVKKFEHLETAQELMLQLQHHPDFTRKHANQEVIDLINANANVLRTAGAGAAAVQRDIDELKKLADRDSMPNILKAVIRECTATANTQQLDMKINRPGAMFNTANGATQKYTLNHATEQYLGKKFRMGSLLHELTHISIAETFKNTCVMLAIKPTATDTEMLALARSRNAKIARLQGLLASSTMDAQLKRECIDKAGYATGTKFASYVTTFTAQLGGPMVARLKNLIAQGMSSELVEYDTVINQMALWCHLWGVPENEPAYAELLTQVAEASQYRALSRTYAKPLPPIPVRAVATPPAVPGVARATPPRKPLPALPVRK